MWDRRTLYPVAVLLLCLLWPGSLPAAQSTGATAPATSGKVTPAKKSPAKKKTPARSATAQKTPAARSKAATASRRTSPAATRASQRRRPASKPTARSIKLTSAFHASEQLRPMAQQLAATRSPAAYAGVLAYAKGHPGEGAAAAYLALGHAYMLDHRDADAITSLAQAKRAGEALDDYADYLDAQAAIQANRAGDAYALLDHFAERYPDSIFVATAPVLLADAHLEQKDAKGALAVLTPLVNTPEAAQSNFQYALGHAYQLAGDNGHAAPIFRKIYATQPLAQEAAEAAAQLQAIGSPLSAGERKTHADALFNAKRYNEASAEYNAIGRNNAQLSTADRNALTIYAAVCDFKLKHLDRRDVEKLPETSDDTAAAKLYMLAELSRNEGDRTGHDAIIAQMLQRFPSSRWLEEALYSGGNMYLLDHDAQQAIYHYSMLVKMFPSSTYAPSAHWRAAWMNYRTRNYPEAARLMDEQIERYPGGQEIPGALYWRGRIYEDEEHNFPQAANYYRKLSAIYTDYYYANLAKQRLAVLGAQPATPPAPALERGAEAAGAGPDGRVAGERYASDQGAAARQCGAQRVHRAGDPCESYLRPVGRAGAGGDLCLLWRVHARTAIHEAQWHLVLHAAHGPGAGDLLASPVPPAILERTGGQLGKQWTGSIPGSVAYPPGIGV